MFIVLISVSILLLVTGVVMVVSPKAVNWLNRSGNIVILTEKKILEHRFMSGVISLLFGVFFMYFFFVVNRNIPYATLRCP